MEDHIIDPEKADALEDPGRYRLCSREELVYAIDGCHRVVDLGSGTGFFTDDIATVAETVHAVDTQAEMHAYYREKGVPANVTLHHADAAAIDDLVADAAVSICSAHELDLPATLSTLASVLVPGGQLFVVDWSANAEGDVGPPREHLYTATEAARHFEEHFDVTTAVERYNTFLLTAKTSKS